MRTRVVSDAELKSNARALLDEVDLQRRSITITRQGRAVAILSPLKRRRFRSPANSWAGRMEIVGDIVNGNPDIWDVVSNPEKDL